MRPAALAAFGGTAGAAISLLLAAASGAPYLTADRVNGWIVVFAATLFVALVAAPFVIEGKLRARRPASGGGLRDERWEGAALAWGAISLAVLVIAIPVGLADSFSGDSLAGSAALLATIEAGLIIATLLAWLLAG